MNLEIATNEQLWSIVENDKECPNDLLKLISIEMIERKLLDNLIVYAAKLVYRDFKYVVHRKLKLDFQEFIQIAHIEILHQCDNFKPGMRTYKTYLIMVLKTKFSKLLRDSLALKRKSEINKQCVDKLDEKIQIRIFRDPHNVEQYVIHKLMFEDSLRSLNDKERIAIQMHLQGYTTFEVAHAVGFESNNSGSRLIKRAQKKIREYFEEAV